MVEHTDSPSGHGSQALELEEHIGQGSDVCNPRKVCSVAEQEHIPYSLLVANEVCYDSRVQAEWEDIRSVRAVDEAGSLVVGPVCGQLCDQ